MERYTQGLVERLVTHLDHDRYALVSPAAGPRRSTLVALRPLAGRDAATVHASLTAAGIDVALREGAVRLSPHLYNTPREIDRALDALSVAQ